MNESPTPPAEDALDLASFGYRQELRRSLGGFSSFAASFSYISILTGSFQLFFFGYLYGGGAFFWTWPLILIGQFAVALCFAEMAARSPIAGSVYQWSRQIARPITAWLAGWILLLGTIATAAAVAIALQVILPQISSSFQIIGTNSSPTSPDGAKNAILLGGILLLCTTIINVIGIDLMARVNNLGVFAEITGVILLIVLFLLHAHHGPAVLFSTSTADHAVSGYGTLGYVACFLVAALMPAWVMLGFDTAGALAEETTDPRTKAPRAIISSLGAAGVSGMLLLALALMAVPVYDSATVKQLQTNGLPYLVKSVLGEAVGDVILLLVALSICVCCLTIHTAAVRIMFSMARDGNLPAAGLLARVSRRSRTPIAPAIAVGVAAFSLLLINFGNPQVFTVVTAVAVALLYIAYLLVTGPLLVRRLRRQGIPGDRPGLFTMGSLGVAVNGFAVIFQVLVIVNVVWPRAAVYGSLRWGGVIVVGGAVLLGLAYYLGIQRHRSGVLDQHRAQAMGEI